MATLWAGVAKNRRFALIKERNKLNPTSGARLRADIRASTGPGMLDGKVCHQIVFDDVRSKPLHGQGLIVLYRRLGLDQISGDAEVLDIVFDSSNWKQS